MLLGPLDADDELVLEAFKRSTPDLATADVTDIHDYLVGLSDEQLVGVASNVKGIAHEIRYVEMENEDGDSVSAVLFGSPTHPDTDVLLMDDATGESWEVQLKATTDSESVRDWIESHPDGQIEVSSELAERLGVDSSGIANAELTADVDDFLGSWQDAASKHSHDGIRKDAGLGVEPVGAARHIVIVQLRRQEQPAIRRPLNVPPRVIPIGQVE